MHRRCLDNILAELFRESFAAEEHQHVLLIWSVFLYLVDQDPYDVTRTSDMAARWVVAAFNHGCHAEDQPVMHLHDVLGLLTNLSRQLVVIGWEQLHVSSRISVVSDQKLVSDRVLSVVEIAYRNEVDLITDFIVNAVLVLVSLEVFEPCESSIFNLNISSCIRVDVDVVEHWEDFPGHLVWTQIIVVKVEWHEARIALVYERIDA